MKRKLNRFWRQITADKKKFGVLVTTLAVGLLLWGRLMLLEKVPRVATADPKPKATAQAEEKSDKPASKTESVLPPLAAVHVDLSEHLSLDLFAFRHNRYKPLPPELTGADGVQSKGPGDDVELRRLQLEERLNELSLQSVIQGPRPMIVVSGRLLRVGDSIDGFEVVSIMDRSARLTQLGQAFKLNMKPE